MLIFRGFYRLPSICLLAIALVDEMLLALGSDGVGSWMHHAVLDSDGIYHLYWTPQVDSIDFKVEVATKGYVGFGLSPNGGMKNSDIVTGWVKDGKAYFQDRHGIGNTLPPIDQIQDWELTSGTENDTHTILIFHRKLQTCDFQDMEIDGSTMRVIYAYYKDDPPSEEMLPYHENNRGSRSMILLQAEAKRHQPLEGLLYWDIKSPNYTITSDFSSIYWCKIVKGPYLSEKHHITRIDPLIQPTHEGFVHHLVLYECVGGTPEDYEPYLDYAGHQCYHPNMPKEMRRCEGVFAAWGVGGESMIFPEHVGMPLDPIPPKYYMLEVHYDNPSRHHGVRDESGFRIYYSPILRQYDAGTFMIGAAVSPRVMIPPGQKSFTVAGHSSTDCLGKKMPEEGVKALGIFLHAHLLGSRLTARHFRQKKELSPFADDRNYDFNYQEYHYFRDEITILPHDQITVECDYNSEKRNQTTFGGLSTQEEMCLAFILYYPKIMRYGSMSVAPMPLVIGLTGALEFMNISAGVLSPNLWDFRHSMTNFDWSKTNITVFGNSMRYSPHEAFCYIGNGNKGQIKELLTYPQNLEVYERPSKCISTSARTKCSEDLNTNFQNGAQLAEKSNLFSLTVLSTLTIIYTTGNN